MTAVAKFEVSEAAVHAGDPAADGPPGVLLTIAGELDVASSPRLEAELRQLLDAGNIRVVIDMADVEFIDASGIGLLVTAADRARAEGGYLLLRRPTERTRRVIDVLGLNGALPVRRDLERTD
jgi:anti-sigma B factor antagonist